MITGLLGNIGLGASKIVPFLKGGAIIGTGLGVSAATDNGLLGVGAGAAMAGFLGGGLFRGGKVLAGLRGAEKAGTKTLSEKLPQRDAKDPLIASIQSAVDTAFPGIDRVSRMGRNVVRGAAIAGAPAIVGAGSGAAAGGAAIAGTAMVGAAAGAAIRPIARYYSGYAGAAKHGYQHMIATMNKKEIAGAAPHITSYFNKLVDTNAGGLKIAGAAIGTMTGTGLAIGREAAGLVGKGIELSAEAAWKHKGAIARKVLLPAAAIGGGGFGVMSSLYTAGQVGTGTEPSNLQMQMTAIGEQFEYERSDIAGMGSTMNFTQSSYSGPLPIMPSFQKKRGYSAAALGATG
ncbi:MAG: hypothetical protein ABIJ08_01310, partial [Nanoarchaeota archaeon]